MKVSRIARLVAALLSAASLVSAQAPSPVGSSGPAGSTARGKVVYERYCISCHGEFGDGEGDTSAWISPRPRDFRQGTFKWRSTPSGSLPLVADLERTITNGLYGTHMPSWHPIGRRNLLDVISYIQTFSPRWREESPEPPIVIPSEPAKDADSAGRGRVVYEKLDCAKCHGEGGRGDGPSSKELKDDWGYPIVPFDLTDGNFRGGSGASDIYRIFMTGLNGAPMPSYAEAISSAEAWDLVHYIQSLHRGTSRRRD